MTAVRQLIAQHLLKGNRKRWELELCSFSLFYFIFVCARMSAFVRAGDMHMYVKARSQCPMSGSLTEPELADSAILAGQQALGIHLSLPS